MKNKINNPVNNVSLKISTREKKEKEQMIIATIVMTVNVLEGVRKSLQRRGVPSKL